MALDKGPVGWFSTAACGRCEETEDKDDAWKWSSVRASASERARKSVTGRGVGGGATGRPKRYQACTLFGTLFTRSCGHVTQRLPMLRLPTRNACLRVPCDPTLAYVALRLRTRSFFFYANAWLRVHYVCARVARSRAHALGVERRFTCCTHDRGAV